MNACRNGDVLSKLTTPSRENVDSAGSRVTPSRCSRVSVRRTASIAARHSTISGVLSGTTPPSAM